MADSTPQVADAEPTAKESDADPFHSMYRMSTTAGVGSGDYLAINAMAVASIFLGVASAAVLFNELGLLFVPALAAICGVLALHGIANSNNTQTGKELAIVGLLLAIGFGGYALVASISASVRNHADERDIAALIHGFGEDLKSGNYHAAYNKCDKQFQSLVPEPYFSGLMQVVTHNSVRGEMTTMDWNGRLAFESNAVTNVYQATGMSVAKFSTGYEPLRINILFSQIDGKWLIDQIPQVFPPDAPTKTAKPSGPLGPPVPSR